MSAAPPADETPTEVAEDHGVCANCQTALAGPYCHACGQQGHLHGRLGHLLEEFAEGIAHLDGRLWRTLPLLAFRPGTLSRRWREGHRVRFVAPMHVFLFAVFLLFVVPSLGGKHLISLPSQAQLGGPLDLQTSEERLTTAARKTATSEDRAELAAATKAARSEQGENLLVPLFAKLNTVLKDNHYYGYRIESLAYKLSWAVVPISMGILWLLMLFKGFTLYDHAVVSLYGLGFVILMVAVARLLPAPVSGALGSLIIWIAGVHAIAHLHGAYGLSWWGATLRGVMLAVLSSIGFSLFVAAVFALGVAG
jgi:hypothetical protein